MNRSRRLPAFLVALLCLGGSRVSVAQGFGPTAEEEARVPVRLGLKAGSVVGEIGAGDGRLTLLVAQAVGPGGRVFSTELGEDKLETLRSAVKRSGQANVSVVAADVRKTGLPAACCEAVFMRDVYHHFTAPDEILADIRRALRPGGRLLIIDFEPRQGLGAVEGVRANRRGHGIPMTVLVEELKAQGFEIENQDPDWRSDLFAVLARVPASSAGAN